MLFSISKHYFPKIKAQVMPMTGVVSGVVTPKDKTKPNPFARLKVGIFSKSVSSFYSFPASLRGGSFTSKIKPQTKIIYQNIIQLGVKQHKIAGEIQWKNHMSNINFEKI